MFCIPVSPSLCEGIPYVVNIKRGGPSPLSTTTARTDPRKARSLGNMQEGAELVKAGLRGESAPALLLHSRASPQSTPSTPIDTPPGYPHKQKLGRRSSLRLDSQEGAASSPSLPSKAPPAGKPVEGRTRTEGKDLRQGAPEVASSPMPPGVFICSTSSCWGWGRGGTRGGTLSSHCIPHPRLGFILGRSG